MQFTRFVDTAPNYDAFILDLWGVIHDGQNLYPGVKDALKNLRARDKKVIFLSNAPRRASRAASVLEAMGITKDLYDAVVTSGETAFRTLEATPRGKNYFYIGTEKDRDILVGLPYREAKQPQNADFALLIHPYYDNQPMSELAPVLEACKANNLPMLCVNPDTEVVRQNGERIFCAGIVAAEYEKIGGKVEYFGKPYPAAYELCFKTWGNPDKRTILAVGDNLATDIAGAKRMGLDSAFVTGGIMHEVAGNVENKGYEARCRELFEREKVTPDFAIPSLG